MHKHATERPVLGAAGLQLAPVPPLPCRLTPAALHISRMPVITCIERMTNHEPNTKGRCTKSVTACTKNVQSGLAHTTSCDGCHCALSHLGIRARRGPSTLGPRRRPPPRPVYASAPSACSTGRPPPPLCSIQLQPLDHLLQRTTSDPSRQEQRHKGARHRNMPLGATS